MLSQGHCIIRPIVSPTLDHDTKIILQTTHSMHIHTMSDRLRFALAVTNYKAQQKSYCLLQKIKWTI